MGWIGTYFNETTHLKFNEKHAYNVLYEYNTTNHHVLGFHLVKAKDKYDHNEIYAAFEDVSGKRFLTVILVDIVEQEILTKVLDESCGPAYTNCSQKLLKLAPVPMGSEYAVSFRKEIKKTNKNQFLSKLAFPKLF